MKQQVSTLSLVRLCLALFFLCGVAVLPAATATAEVKDAAAQVASADDSALTASAEMDEEDEEDEEEEDQELMSEKQNIFFAVAILMSCACLSAAYAMAKIGVAAMGAAAEKPEILGKAIPFVGLGEGIALFGFLISLFIILKL